MVGLAVWGLAPAVATYKYRTSIRVAAPIDVEQLGAIDTSRPLVGIEIDPDGNVTPIYLHSIEELRLRLDEARRSAHLLTSDPAHTRIIELLDEAEERLDEIRDMQKPADPPEADPPVK